MDLVRLLLKPGKHCKLTNNSERVDGTTPPNVAEKPEQRTVDIGVDIDPILVFSVTYRA